jgi:hypothetical protein
MTFSDSDVPIAPLQPTAGPAPSRRRFRSVLPTAPQQAGTASGDRDAASNLPRVWTVPQDPPARPADPRRPGIGGHMCGLFAVDIAGFTDPRRDEQVQLYLRDMLYRMLERAFDGSGVPWHACEHEDRGDGVLVIVPPIIPVDGLADPLPERLCGLVRVHNRMSSEEAHIQLRAAAHVGRVYRDDHGFAGDSPSHLRRLLDTPTLKQLLATSGAELAFIASNYFYETIIRRHPTLVDPAAFQPVSVDTKHETATGWVQLVGSASSTARILHFGRSA